MRIFRTLDISASGLVGQRARMDAITDDLANSNRVMTGTGAGPYRGKIVVLQSEGTGAFADVLQGPGAVKVAGVVETQDGPRELLR
jgi:flagellar basal body rod protein FlgC